MKEFDIEKAKAGAPVCTRDGRPARIICWDYQGYNVEKEEDKFPIIALVKCYDGERAFLYRETGKTRDKKIDIMMAPVKHEGWVNINPAGKYCFSTIFDTQEEAEARASSATIEHVTVHIEWEE